ncbi:MAG TPA: M23 family metallopeptidase [Thermoanaerobacterales bacterium]|nr:M23 family metallopeptidase [Thermoanaerobacterales bacterium]
MYRFKWPVKFSLPAAKFEKVLKAVRNMGPMRMLGRMPKGAMAFTAVLAMLLCVNGAFWYFRATHRDIGSGREQTPELKEWQINLNEDRVDEGQMKKEYSLPGSGEKPAEKDIKQTGDISDKKSENSVKNQAHAAVKGEASSLKEQDEAGNEAKAEIAAVVSQPSLATMAMPAVGKVIADYAVDKLIYSKTLEQWNSHGGIDIAAEEGTPVKAAMDGTVAEVRKSDPRLGVVVIIDHGGDVRTLYANLSSDKLVQKGKYVKKGQIIGAVGRTAPYEIEDPPHLHFEVLKGGENIDPQQYLPKIN